MSTELEELYKKANIDINTINENAKSSSGDLKFSINKKEQLGSFNYVLDTVNITGMSKNEIEYAMLSDNLFDTQEEALNHIEYLDILDKLVAAARKVNIVDNNYKADFNNEDERKYCVAYNHRTKSVNYDFVYTILVQYTDYRLVFRTQQIAENFINNCRNDLIFVNNYRIEKMLY